MCLIKAKMKAFQMATDLYYKSLPITCYNGFRDFAYSIQNTTSSAGTKSRNYFSAVGRQAKPIKLHTKLLVSSLSDILRASKSVLISRQLKVVLIVDISYKLHHLLYLVSFEPCLYGIKPFKRQDSAIIQRFREK